MNDDKKKESKPAESGDSAVVGTYQTYRAEFRKIVWPSKETLIKHTVTVIAVSLIFGAYIALNDFVFSNIFRQFVSWVL
ncbi:MAG: preprotein translocase subunit SecE [Defluviitaleaceae bacterium]|nr:preprotein translocase subunit SecE [Defluviitaleaceae bacterium]